MAEAMDVTKVPFFYVWAVVGALSSYIFRILIAKNLSPERYGSFYAVLGLVMFLILFTDLGFNSSFLYHFTKWQKEKKRASVFTLTLGTKMLLSTGIGILLAIFHKWIAREYLHSPALSNAVLLYSIYFIIEGVYTLLVQYHGGANNYGRYAMAGNFRMLLVLILTIPAIIFVPDAYLLTIIFLVWMIAFFLSALTFLFGVPFRSLITFSPDWSLLRPLTRYALFTSFSAAGGLVLNKLDILFITYFRSASEVGFYETAIPLATALLLLIIPLIRFLSPSVMQIHHKKDERRLSKTFKGVYNAGVFFLLPVATFLILFAREIILVLFGVSYLPATIALQVLAAGYFFNAFQQINLLFLYGTGHVKKQMQLIWLGAIVNILLNLLFIPKYGFVAAAWTTLISFLIMLIMSFPSLKEVFDFSLPWRNWGKSFLLCAFALLLALLAKKLISLSVYVEAVLISSLFFSSYFIIGFFFLRIIDRDRFIDLFFSLLQTFRFRKNHFKEKESHR